MTYEVNSAGLDEIRAFLSENSKHFLNWPPENIPSGVVHAYADDVEQDEQGSFEISSFRAVQGIPRTCFISDHGLTPRKEAAND